VQSGNLTDYQQLDRATAAFRRGRLAVTVGRQAIGWGRGVLFSAVDIFAPFTPLQIDQEWRDGVDAASLDWKLADAWSVSAVSAWGPTWSSSALGGRIRGYFGPVDAEILVAKRAQDTMYGLTSSAAIGDAEAHGELAIFQTPGDIPSSGVLGNATLVPKAVLGASKNFQVGSGLKVTLEYHYSGFGAATPSALAPLLANPAFLARLARGDTQIAGAQALGWSSSYTFDIRWSATLTLLQSLIDDSGVIAPSATWDISDNASLLASIFIAYGRSPSNGSLQSQFGAVPPTAILQLRLYD
jgi:hypothetical protein